MSFIGPRPDTPMYLDKYTEEERIVLTVYGRVPFETVREIEEKADVL